MKCWKRVEILDTPVTEVIWGKDPKEVKEPIMQTYLQAEPSRQREQHVKRR